MAYQIITDGSCDLGIELAEENNIRVVPFYVSFDDKTYQKEMEEVPVREFYQKMVDNPDVFPKSSLPSIMDFYEVFKEYAEKGLDIICICITTKFSGSYNSASNAKDMILDDYPDARIEVIDSTVNTVLQGILVLEVARLWRAGWSYDDTIRRIYEILPTGRIIFTVGSFDYLIHGGRIGKVMGAAASTLAVKPLIILKEGEIFPAGIYRAREKGKASLLKLLKSHFIKSKESPADYVFTIGYGYDYEEAVHFRDLALDVLKEFIPAPQISLLQIGATIGVHTGPFPIGIALIKKAIPD